MSARYIVRLDDACPTMRREIWDPLEAALDRLGIRPIVGVIPDNGDPSMLCSEPDPDFWDRVHNWQDKGWGIALHGLHHTYHAIPPGTRPLIPPHTKSEFVGLNLDGQRSLVRESWRIFFEHGIKPAIFMAPSHTFDNDTLEALVLETDIRIVTDGLALSPFRDGRFTWVPQQLWRFRWLPFGTWTICLHPNTLTVAGLDALVGQLTRFADKTISVDTALAGCTTEKTIFDKLFASSFALALNVKRQLAG